ncbi:uracil-DNA glycosylase-like isoform X2 [Zootermopsis nevadensis]|uniref:uracil-DNA glycosylase-like isoform X2 n=1 Tax=Zootermopsis nevadensis TaxID=136037 RepID=UPI000B8E68DF|nr:uracil-DNA glycosylase-like isoform X2 [Zootermopsis nevadensis]
MSCQKKILNFFKPLSPKRPLLNVTDNIENQPNKKLKPEPDINGQREDFTSGGNNKEIVGNSPFFYSYVRAKIKLTSKRFPALHTNIGETWFQALSPEFGKPYFAKLSQFLVAERASHTVYPPEDQVWTWTHMCPVSQVKVVILGQDPYHNPQQAHGLCFSVPARVPPPPSLLNMYKELSRDIPGFEAPNHGNLIGWARQGVLLLNACLTVRAHNANSHKDQGWEQLTDAVVKHISDNSRGVIFLLWGSYAQKRAAAVDKTVLQQQPGPRSMPV